VTPDLGRTTFEDLARMLLDDYHVNGHKSLETAEGSLKALRATFGLYRAQAITLDQLNTYVAARLALGRKPATIRNELAALKRAFHLAERAGKAVCPPFPTLSVRNARAGFFEEADFRAVLVHLSAELRPVAEFAYLTGWRKAELLSLTWAQVDLRAGTVRLEPGTTKNSEGRTFPFAALPALGALLAAQYEWTRAVEKTAARVIPWVFHRNGVRVKDFRGAWDKACKAAGVPGRLFHDFRRTAVRNLERVGVPRSVAMKLTGHKTESVYRRYAIVSEADLTEGVRKLAALHAATAASPRTVVPLSQPERL
jgi:integrase